MLGRWGGGGGGGKNLERSCDSHRSWSLVGNRSNHPAFTNPSLPQPDTRRALYSPGSEEVPSGVAGVGGGGGRSKAIRLAS